MAVTMSADERKLLRKLVTERAARAEMKVRVQRDAELAKVRTLIPISELPATDHRRIQAEELNALLDKVNDQVQRTEGTALRISSGYEPSRISRYEKITHIRVPDEEANAEREKIRGAYQVALDAIEDKTTEALVTIVAGGMPEEITKKLKEFTADLDKLVG